MYIGGLAPFFGNRFPLENLFCRHNRQFPHNTESEPRQNKVIENETEYGSVQSSEMPCFPAVNLIQST